MTFENGRKKQESLEEGSTFGSEAAQWSTKNAQKKGHSLPENKCKQ